MSDPWQRLRRILPGLILGVALPAGADPGYSLDWRVMAGGGGSSSGSSPSGVWTLSATIAQAAPGPAAGGGYSLSAGYWVNLTPPPAGIFADGFESAAP